MDAESYQNDEVAGYINNNFVPVEANIKEHGAWFKRFDVAWTPTALLLDDEGKERYRIEGYLPRNEFFAQVKLGLARVAFQHKRWADAEAIYEDIIQHHPNSATAAEAIYWRGVARYKRTNDHTVLGEVAREFTQRFQSSIWAEKASIWAH